MQPITGPHPPQAHERYAPTNRLQLSVSTGIALWPTGAERFFAESRTRLRSARSVALYGSVLRRLHSTYPHASVADFEERELIAFLNSNGSWSPATVRLYRTVLTSFFSWAEWEGLCSPDPTRHLRKRVRVPLRGVRTFNWLGAASVWEVMDAASGDDDYDLRDRAVLALGFFAGLRASEIGSLSWDDVRLAAREIHLRGKGNQPAVVGIGPDLLVALRDWQARYEYRLGRPVRSERVVVALPGGEDEPGRFGAPSTKSTVLDIVRRRGTEAGIPTLRPHDLRRTFAGLLDDGGWPLHDIRRALRHVEIRSTQTYLEQSTRKQTAVGQEFSIPRTRTAEQNLQPQGQ